MTYKIRIETIIKQVGQAILHVEANNAAKAQEIALNYCQEHQPETTILLDEQDYYIVDETIIENPEPEDKLINISAN